MYTLYADGIHDDRPALQELLDSGAREVVLPPTQACYRIGRTLKIHAGQTLRAAPTTKIMLLPGADCAMLENDDFGTWAQDICIDGGIWDMCHAEQSPNPGHFPDKNGKLMRDYAAEIGFSPRTATALPPLYTGFCMRFCRVKNFTLKNATFKNPVTYAVQIAYAEDFTFRDIYFDYTEGSPKLWNMDGIHVEGHCRNGAIYNVKGVCHDDTIALTTDDSLYGPIENITVDGIACYGTHSAVRLLSHGTPLRNIHITNVYGTYYTYCVGLTWYHGGENERGRMENITIDHVYASHCKGTVDVPGNWAPLIWVEKGMDVENLTLRDVFRDEKVLRTPMLGVDKGAVVDGLVLCDVVQKSSLEDPPAQLSLEGEVRNMTQIHVVDRCKRG